MSEKDNLSAEEIEKEAALLKEKRDKRIVDILVKLDEDISEILDKLSGSGWNGLENDRDS
jgi:hypothetical protein